MVSGELARAVGWTIGATFVSLAAGVGSLDGLAWMWQPVRLPLVAVIVLAILPAESFGKLAQTGVERVNTRLELSPPGEDGD